MVKTTYKCDKCSKEQDSNVQFWTVSIIERKNIETPKPPTVEELIKEILSLVRED